MFSRLKNSEGRRLMIRRLFAAFSRYRPRVLTLAVLAAIAAMIGLANLSEEFSSRKVDPRKFNLSPPPSELEFDTGESFAS